MRRILKQKKGISLAEVLIAAGLGTLIIGLVITAWYFVYKTWMVEHVKSSLRVDLEIGIEKIKEDLRLSSATYLVFYPSGAGPYTAISFPQATPDANGFLTLDSNDHIVWDKTVIYHLNTAAGVTDLRKTVIEPRDNTLSEAARYTELATIVANGGNASTKIVLRNLAPSSFEINRANFGFDCYSPALSRSNLIDFGSIYLTTGSHDITFEITGKNSLSGGYGMGIDSFSISPSGGNRDAEIYLPPQAVTGGVATKIYASGWSGDNYVDFSSGSVGDSLTFRFYYDTWNEPNFDTAMLSNVIVTGNDLVCQLPGLTEGNEIMWQADLEASSVNGDAVKSDYNDGSGTPVDMTDITVRNVISAGGLDEEVDMVRFSLDAHSANPVVISSVYLDERAAGQNAVDPATGNSRIQLFFTDSGAVTPGITIDAGTSVFTNWAIFDIDPTKDYLLTIHVTSGNISYWAGTESTDINSYMRDGDHSASATWIAPSAHQSEPPPAVGSNDCFSSPDIYISGVMEGWVSQGTVTSSIYDTKIANPSYGNITWTDNVPSGTLVVMKARSSDDENMVGATSFDIIAGASGPYALGIGAGRYVQFQAVLSSIPYWTCLNHSGVSISDVNYKAGTKTCSVGGEPLIPSVNVPWIDNVAIDWPGEPQVCDISAYMTLDSDYGIVKVSIDGIELTKALQFNITTEKSLVGQTYQESLSAEVSPTNTGN